MSEVKKDESSSPSSNEKYWQPTARLFYGIMIKPFLPLQKYPELVYHNAEYSNLYPGGEVYIFEETTDQKWCRAYLCSRPLPDEFIAIMSSLVDKLPDIKPRIVVFPTRYCNINRTSIVTKMPFFKLPELHDFDTVISDQCTTSSLFESLSKVKSSELTSATTGTNLSRSTSKSSSPSNGSRKPSRPGFPFFRYQKRPFIEEIGPVLSLLSSHIYAMYSAGEFKIYENLKDLYYELDNIRLRLQYSLITASERIKIIRTASCLLGRIAKYIASKGKSDKFYNETGSTVPNIRSLASVAPTNIDQDPYAFEAIFARDINTGELLDYESSDCQTLVLSTMLSGLTNTFPVSSFNILQSTIQPNKLFRETQSHILVDFNDVTSDPSMPNPKFENMVAYVHLRTKNEILTESFIVDINSENILSLDNISAVLFKNISTSLVEREKIYIAIILTETVPIIPRDKQNINFKPPFVPFKSETEDTISQVKFGIAAGVADISAVFENRRTITSSKSSRNFNIRLFGTRYSESSSFSSKTPRVKSTNLGWGGIIDQILHDSPTDIVVNPRAISISVTVKEFLADHISEEDKTYINKLEDASSVPFLPNNQSAPMQSAIKTISTKFYDNIFRPIEKISLTLGKVSLVGLENKKTNIKNISVHISSRNENVKFSKHSYGNLLKSWEFVSVHPSETIGETILIHGLESMSKDETLRLLVYLNGYLMAKSNIYIKKDNNIVEYGKNTTFELTSSLGKPLIHLDLKTKYEGVKYSLDPTVKEFMNIISNHDSSEPNFNKNVLTVVQKLNKVSIDELAVHFDIILPIYLELLFITSTEDNINSEFIDKMFLSYVQFIDITLVSNEICKVKFNEFVKMGNVRNDNSLPKLGPKILNHLTKLVKQDKELLHSRDDEYNQVSTHLLLISVISSNGIEPQWKTAFEDFFTTICDMLKSTEESDFIHQISFLKAYDIWLNTLDTYYTAEELIKFTEDLFNSCQEKENELSFATKKITMNDKEYLTTKFLLLRRILDNDKINSFLFTEEAHTTQLQSDFLSRCLELPLQPYLLDNDEDLAEISIRLANSVTIKLIENIKNERVLKNIIKLLPMYCQLFISTWKDYKKADNFKSSRIFTRLFPTQVPFPKLPIDSIVNHEIVSELLLELSTIICEICKISSTLYGSEASFSSIIEECQNDTQFQTMFYLKEVSIDTVSIIIQTINVLFEGDFFPNDKWLGVTALFARSSLHMLMLCQDFMIKHNSPITIAESQKKEGGESIEINMSIWAEYFKCLLMISNHKVLTWIKLAIIPRKASYLLTGNLKNLSAELLNTCWDALGCTDDNIDVSKLYGISKISSYQRSLVTDYPNILRDIFIFAFHRHIVTTKISCKIIWSVAINFWLEYESFQPVLNLFIPELYNAYQIGKLFVDDYELNRFISCLFYTIHVPTNNKIYPFVLNFLKEMLGFLHIISEMYKIPSQQEFDDDRTARHIEIFGYLLDANRPELFHKMINDLYIHFVMKKDYVQAGLCLELLASTYLWEPNDFLEASKYPPMPEQSSFERKEYLYKEAARNFSKGLKLEKALSVYKDLIKAYDEINYDLNGLAFVHDQIATIYTDLQLIDRLVPTFFKVSFLGYGFPNSLRNKRFIFEGLPFEHITSMHSRLLKIYHGSTIVQTQEEADQLLLNPPMGKYIHVNIAEPKLAISEEYTNSNKNGLNNKIRMYIENRDLNTFINSRRLPGSTSVTDLWVVEYTYETISTFPTLMNRSEIRHLEKKKLSPLENAMRSLQMKIQELNGLENMCYKTIKEMMDSSELFNELSRNLMGTISAPINGGIAQYKEFLKPPVVSNYSQQEVNKLTMAFDELAISLSRCLVLHLHLLPCNQYKNSHSVLVELFEQNFKEEVERNHIKVNNMTLEMLTRTLSRRSSERSLMKKQVFSSWDSSSNNTGTFPEPSINSMDSLSQNSNILSTYLSKTSRSSSHSLGNSNLNVASNVSQSQGMSTLSSWQSSNLGTDMNTHYHPHLG
ncbi:guanine nucleotide exchange factor DCK1 NDAI_0J02570 [Naumovozyma dairenensis CBS 421]|uniref:DOCKER domain-containing protein n=1 Tax=Naumovozyma dairenensis (strain ATCC 10597 / BCRC 20456 / CBS 421 / NBRC 0211 / NRRL Y-12639) TaxID=1071378 RepID=G0WH71_NAUDC|nr:hypothetical protein NDAI_0J02570 [Naumovozyma dairenensis CBS 421]CCD27149.1 hypothetical protein NDAI_0J02570 [Naumovozyma dairenensis CBS 421]